MWLRSSAPPIPSSRPASRPVHCDWASMKYPPGKWRVLMGAIMGAEAGARQEKGDAGGGVGRLGGRGGRAAEGARRDRGGGGEFLRRPDLGGAAGRARRVEILPGRGGR